MGLVIILALFLVAAATDAITTATVVVAAGPQGALLLEGSGLLGELLDGLQHEGLLAFLWLCIDCHAHHLVNGIVGGLCGRGQDGLELLAEAVLGFLGAGCTVETTIICLHLLVLVAVTNYVVVIDKENLEMGKVIVDRLCLPLR